MGRSTTWPPRCGVCNHFMSYEDMADAVLAGPYASTVQRMNLEPPDPPRWYHAECWDGMTDKRREQVKRISRFIKDRRQESDRLSTGRGNERA